MSSESPLASPFEPPSGASQSSALPPGHARAVPPPLGPNPTDLEHLRWLSIAHYVLACFAILGGCCGFIYVGAGAAVMFVPPPANIPNQPAAPTSAPNQQPPPANVPNQPPPPPQFMAPLMGGMFAFLGVAIMILAWTMGAALFLSGRWLTEHRNWTFCLVVACLSMLNQPLGTILGIFTLIVLLRPSVKELFRGQVATTAKFGPSPTVGPGGSPFAT